MIFLKVAIATRAGFLGGVARSIYLGGDRRAWDIIMTGRTVCAQEAERIGLITRCLPENEFDEFVLNYPGKLCEKPPGATRLAKALKAISEKVSLESAYEYENELISLCFDANETRELMWAFINPSKAAK